MRGKILLKALEIIHDQAMSQVDFFAAVIAAGYGASMSALDYEYDRRQRARNIKNFHGEELKERKKRLKVFIAKMKHDGLIEELENDKVKISTKGKEKIIQLKGKLPDRHYQADGRDNAVIISFDIPEKLRRKRDWLREVIRNLGFQMVHQSVWLGKVKIPKDFLEDLANLNILEFIEIFEISKTGSLRKLA